MKVSTPVKIALIGAATFVGVSFIATYRYGRKRASCRVEWWENKDEGYDKCDYDSFDKWGYYWASVTPGISKKLM